MSAVTAKITQALLPLLTTTLLAMACSDSTGPSSTDSSTKADPTFESPTNSPAESSDTADGMRPLTDNMAGLLGMAYSEGISCYGSTLQQNLPNMTSISGQIESTYFWSYLYKWNPQLNAGHGGWQYWTQKGPYKGASNGSGRLPILGNAYWLISGRRIGNTDYFSNLSSGYYMTVERYMWANTASATFSNAYRYCRI
jgi:hypothetical protein